MPSPVREKGHRASTRSSLSAASPASVIRFPSTTDPGSSGTPFSSIDPIDAAMRSTKVVAPGSEQAKRTTLVEANSVSATVRSRATS